MNYTDNDVDIDKLMDVIFTNPWKCGKSMLFRNMAVITKRKIEFRRVILWEKGQGNILYALLFNYIHE